MRLDLSLSFFRCIPACIGVLLLCATAYGQAQLSAPASYGPQTWVRGGSGVATAFNDDAFQLNPAGLVRFKNQASLGGSWLTPLHGIDRWSVSLVDGTRQAIGGLAFDWTEQNGIRQMAFRPAAAYRTPYGSFGSTVDILEYKGLASKDGWYISHTTGIYVPVVFNFAIAASVKSLVDNESDQVLPPEMMVGAVYRKESAFQLSFQADRRFKIQNQDWNYSTSVEVNFQKFYSLQGGVRFDNTIDDGSFWSAGLLMQAPRVDFSGFYTKRIKSSQDGFGFATTFLF